jgi:hypothetical protein
MKKNVEWKMKSIKNKAQRIKEMRVYRVEMVNGKW